MSESDLPEEVDPDDARLMLAKGEVRSIDVRDVDDIADEGHPPATVVVGDRSPKEAADEVLRGDEVPILVFSDGGDRGKEVAAELREAGIEAAAVKGGYGKWVSEGEPTNPRDADEYEGPELKQPGQS